MQTTPNLNFKFETEIRSRLGPLSVSPSGFESRNCMLCHLSGHSKDHRGRFGIIFTSETISINCFNCGFKAVYEYGTKFSSKFMTFLSEIGFSKNDISKWQFQFFAKEGRIMYGHLHHDSDSLTSSFPHDIVSSWPKVDQENMSLTDLLNKDIIDWKEKKILEYAISRNLLPYFDYLEYDHNTPNRILIPFKTWNNDKIGYTGRIVFGKGPKYLDVYPDKSKCKNYLFNYAFQLTSNHKYVIVVDGVLDALRVDGIALMSSRISETQEKMIDYLTKNKTVIVVPDYDKAGTNLIDIAEKYRWYISAPNWSLNLKDVDDMVMKYGQLATVKAIIMHRNKNYSELKTKAALTKLTGEK